MNLKLWKLVCKANKGFRYISVINFERVNVNPYPMLATITQLLNQIKMTDGGFHN